MSTRAIQQLNKDRVPFEIVTYVHEQKGAAYAARAIGCPLEQIVKTLISSVGIRGHVAALLPGNRRLDLKKLAKAFRVKQAVMADAPTAERLSGYKVGGISPFGMKQPLDSILDRSVLKYPTIAINGGKRGLMLEMSPKDIVAMLACKVADIGTENLGF